MNVRYRVGKTEKIGRNKELDIMDLEDEGIEFVELRWTRTRKVLMSEQICGFQDYIIMRNRQGDKMDRRAVSDSSLVFWPDERNVGYAYMLKTTRNMILLAGILKDKICKPTDSEVVKELKVLQKKFHFKAVADLRDHSLDGVLKRKATKERHAELRNADLKEKIRARKVEQENEELERELYLMDHPEEVVIEANVEVLPSNETPEKELTAAEELAATPTAAEELASQTKAVDELKQPKREINTKNLKKK